MKKTPTAAAVEPAPAAPAPWRYEDAVRQVESIIHQIESGDLDLAEVFSQFERAIAQLNQCEAFLSQQQEKMTLLIETLSDAPSEF